MRVRRPAAPGSVSQRQSELVPLAEAMVTRAVQLNLTEQQTLAVVKNVLKERRAWLKQSSTSTS